VVCKRILTKTRVLEATARVNLFPLKASTVITSHKSLVRYRSRADKSLHELRTAMHHHPQNHERAINPSLLTVFGPGEFSRVESN
jgi:hypothetical protein